MSSHPSDYIDDDYDDDDETCDVCSGNEDVMALPDPDPTPGVRPRRICRDCVRELYDKRLNDEVMIPF